MEQGQGMDVLIKSVVHAIPTFLCGMFQTTKRAT
jgi:hypothetical protein